MNLWFRLKKKFKNVVMSLLKIYIFYPKNKNIKNNENQQILWIIDCIEHWVQNGLSHVLPLICNVRKTSYTSSSHVMLLQRHGWHLKRFSFFFFFFFSWILFSHIQEFNTYNDNLNGKCGISLSLALPCWSMLLIVYSFYT